MSHLIRCFVCKELVSENATVCPHCGEPDFRFTNEKDFLTIKELREKTDKLLRLLDTRIEQLDDEIAEIDERLESSGD